MHDFPLTPIVIDKQKKEKRCRLCMWFGLVNRMEGPTHNGGAVKLLAGQAAKPPRQRDANFGKLFETSVN